MKRVALFAGALVAAWTVCATVACGSDCSIDADCPTTSKHFCCAGKCVPDDAANCGACGNACLLASGTCSLQASWKCISPSDVVCTCDGKNAGGDCVCPSAIHVQAPFMCPTCDATLEQFTKLSTLCNVSAPTP